MNEFVKLTIHGSPTEHQAFSLQLDCKNVWADGVTHLDRNGQIWSANFRMPWVQYRQTLGG